VGEEEITPEKLAEQIRQLRIEDIVLSTVSTLGQLAYAKLDAKELEQARLAIDAIAALLPTLEGHVEAGVLRDFKQLLANVRLAFASTVSASGSEPQAQREEPAPEAGPVQHTGNGDERRTEASQNSGSGSEPQTNSE
jgi:hypothetical protein